MNSDSSSICICEVASCHKLYWLTKLKYGIFMIFWKSLLFSWRTLNWPESVVILELKSNIYKPNKKLRGEVLWFDLKVWEDSKMAWSKITRERYFEGRKEGRKGERELTILDFAIGWIKEWAYGISVYQYGCF